MHSNNRGSCIIKTIFTTLDPVLSAVMDPALQGTDLKQNPILAGTNALK
jgi:hypothetical protein